MKATQKGFSVIEILLVIVVIGLVGAVGWLVYDRQNNKGGSQLSTQNNEQKQDTEKDQVNSDPYANWKNYNSTKGGFSIKYPSDWLVTGYKGTTIVEASKLKGDEDQLRIQQKGEGESKADNFAINFSIGASLPDYRWASDLTKLGKVTILSQDISVLDENETQTLPSGEQKNECPTIWVIADNQIGMRLKNGQFLDFSGSYCWGQGMTTTLSFDQTKSSKP